MEEISISQKLVIVSNKELKLINEDKERSR
jgi:hypothetical protein